MKRSHVRFTVRRLMIVVTALGLNFGVVPWPACAVMGAAITLPLFVSFGTLIEWVMIYCIAVLLAALSIPAVATNCRLGPPALPSSASIPVAVPTYNGPGITETPEL
jgi:hypothetical protein